MSLKTKIWLGVIFAVVSILAGGVFYISTIDWNNHKDKISAQVESVIGKTMVFDGPLNLRLFPSPYLTASNIKIYNKGGDTPIATVKSMVASLSLMPLLQGNFDVQRMSLVEPEILFEISDDRRLNWENEQVIRDDFTSSNVEVTLDSVTLEKASVRVLFPKRDIDVKMENLNAEVIAQSIMGPYRIEGSYLRENNPEGFAISIGKMTDSFATPVNFALNYPVSETYLRFDGTLLLQNDAVDGNVVFESKKLAQFMKNTFKINLPKEYNYPLAVSTELNTSKTKADLKSLVVKYGQTVGMGNVSVPLANTESAPGEEEGRKKVTFSFDMTDFDLDPAVYLLKTVMEKYAPADSEFYPAFDFDLASDIRAVKTMHNNQIIKDLNLVFDVVDNNFNVVDLSAILPGESLFRAEGRVFSDGGRLSYTMKNELTTNDFQSFAKWLGHDIPIVNDATYRKANINAEVEGNLEMIRGNSVKVVLDKTALEGEFGAILSDERNKFIFVGDIDTINFDNYISPMPKEMLDKSFAEKMRYKFEKLGFFKRFDLQFIATLGLGIYENIPFENTDANVNFADEVLTIENLDIYQVAGSNIAFSGKVSGFGTAPVFEDFTYKIETNDMVSLLSKFDIPAPDVNLKDFKGFSSNGVLNGTLDNLNLTANSKLDNFENVLKGNLSDKEGGKVFEGEFELKAPDFVKFIGFMNYKYSPNTISLGMFNLKADVLGNFDRFRATNINANVGTNNFQGGVILNKTGDRNNVVANLVLNKFEIDRFAHKNREFVQQQADFAAPAADRADFLSKTVLDRAKINYTFLNSFNMKSKFSVKQLSYKDMVLSDANFDFSLDNGLAKLDNFMAGYHNGEVFSNLELMAGTNPLLKGKIIFTNLDILEKSFSGRKYGIKSGKLNANIEFTSNANSYDAMLNDLDAKIDFNIVNPVFKGWNLSAIRSDFKKREYSAGLSDFVKQNLQTGEVLFDDFAGSVEVIDSVYNFESSKFTLKDVSFIMENDGNLKDWSMKSLFKAKFEDVKVPAFQFSLLGGIDNPELLVDVEEIANTYDSYWAEVKAKKQVEEDALKKQLSEGMQAAQARVDELIKKLDDEVLKFFEVRKEQVFDRKVAETYENVSNEIDEIQKLLGEVKAYRNVKDFSLDDIDNLSAKNDLASSQTEQVKKELAGVYVQDVKIRINLAYNKVVGAFNKAKERDNSYKDAYISYVKRLSDIKTDVSLGTDAEVKRLRGEIDKALVDLERLSNEAVKVYIKGQGSQNLEELDNIYTEASDYQAEAEVLVGLVDEDIGKLFEHVEGLVLNAEKAYKEELELKAKKDLEEKEKQEAAKALLVPAAEEQASETKAAVEEIVENPEETKPEEVPAKEGRSEKIEAEEVSSEEGEVRILDFSVDKVDEVPLGDGFLKPQGSISKPSGIIRK